MRLTVCAVAACLGLAGCESVIKGIADGLNEPQRRQAAAPSEEHLKQRLNVLLGHQETEIVQTFGVPAASYQTSGAKFLRYVINSGSSMTISGGGGPVMGASASPMGRALASDTQVSTTTYGCEITLQVTNSVVTHWSYKGNNCVAPPMRS